MKKFFKKWSTVIVLSLALGIIIIDSTVLNVSLRNLISDLNTNMKSLQTIITTYSLVTATLLITGGRLGDIFGRKKMFLTGAVLFGIGSLIASFSKDTTTLLIGWSIIEGIGAALMMPATSSLLLSAYQGKDRALAFGIWGGIAGAAAALGPLLGGWITQNYSWNWAFRINPIIVLAILALAGFIHEYQEKDIDRHLDWPGIFLSATGLAAIIYPIIESGTYGWWKAKEVFSIFGHTLNTGDLSIVPILMAIGLLILTVFYFWEKKVKSTGKTPLIDVDMFNQFQFSSGLTTMTIISLSQMGLFFSLPMFFQAVQGLNAYETGKAFLPMSIASLIVAPLSSQLQKKISPKYLIVFGVLVNGIGAYLLKNTLSVGTTSQELLIPMLCFGVGMGAVMAQISNLTLSAISTEKAGEASGVMSTMRNVGSSFGSAIIGAVFLATLSTAMIDKVNADELLPAPVKQVFVEKAGEDASQFEFGIPENSGMPKEITVRVKNIVNEAIVDANKDSLDYTLWFTAIALLSSLFLPNTKLLSKEDITAKH